MKQKQIIALVSATALATTALAGCGKTSEESTQTIAVSEANHIILSEPWQRSEILLAARPSRMENFLMSQYGFAIHP